MPHTTAPSHGVSLITIASTLNRKKLTKNNMRSRRSRYWTMNMMTALTSFVYYLWIGGEIFSLITKSMAVGTPNYQNDMCSKF